MEELALVLPSMEWEKQAEDYRRSYFENGEEHINGSSAMERYPGYSEWLDRVNDLRKLPASEEQTQATTFFAVRKGDGRIVGTIQVRHRLTGELCRSGGNIGYGVRPEERGKGYAAQMLTLALDFCREIGLERVLLDCRTDNTASERTIRKCGGIPAGEAQVPDENGRAERIRRFWIAL